MFSKSLGSIFLPLKGKFSIGGSFLKMKTVAHFLSDSLAPDKKSYTSKQKLYVPSGID